MKKLVGIAAVLICAGAISATAAASLRTYVVGTKFVKGVGTVGSFRASVKKPYKIVLYCEGANARCSTSVICVRGTQTFTQSRTGLTPGTWNVKKPTWYRLDSCRFKATVRSGFRDARVTVQATVRP